MARMRHVVRPKVGRHHPVHVTLRLAPGVHGLRNRHAWAILRRCFHGGRDRFGFRLNHFSIQHTHIHMIAEADDARALARGMQGLCIRIAYHVNKHLERSGKVLADRYHVHVLKTPRETRHALAYCLLNARRHAAQEGLMLPRDWYDPYSSAGYFDGWADGMPPPPEELAPIVPARTWLLTTGWRRHRLIIPWEVPASARE
ncbi:MAG: hypothetical protein HY698_03850 [Deltaproteobacteria bacterium]|nr:hypothetical protein [Deltaproteobacteria bacterium]